MRLKVFYIQPLTALLYEPSSDLRLQFDHHIVPFLDQFRALLDQQIRPPTGLLGDVAWNGENLAVLLRRKLRSDRRAGIFAALHYHHPHADAADNPVADREVLRIR